MLNLLTICAVLIGPLNTIEWADDGNFGTEDQTELLQNIMVHYTLDEAAGQSRLDSGSGLFHLVENGAGTVASVAGKLTNAVRFGFSGFGGHRLLSVETNFFNFANYDAWSINFWFKLNENERPGDDWILGNNTESKPQTGFFMSPPVLFSFRAFTDSAYEVINAPDILTISEWTMITVTFQQKYTEPLGFTASFYLGTNSPNTETKTSGLLNSVTNSFYVGNPVSVVSRIFCEIDNLSIWTNRVLVLDEIIELYNDGNGLLFENFNNP